MEESIEDIKDAIMEEVERVASLDRPFKERDDEKAGYFIVLDYIGSFVEIRNKMLILDFVEKHFNHNDTLDKRLFKDIVKSWKKYHKEKKGKLN